MKTLQAPTPTRPLGPQRKTLKLSARTLTFSPACGHPGHLVIDDGSDQLILPREDAWGWALSAVRTGTFETGLMNSRPSSLLSRHDVTRICRELRRWHHPRATFLVWNGPDHPFADFFVPHPHRSPDPVAQIMLGGGVRLGDAVDEWHAIQRTFRRVLQDAGPGDVLSETDAPQRLLARRRAERDAALDHAEDDAVMPF